MVIADSDSTKQLPLPLGERESVTVDYWNYNRNDKLDLPGGHINSERSLTVAMNTDIDATVHVSTGSYNITNGKEKDHRSEIKRELRTGIAIDIARTTRATRVAGEANSTQTTLVTTITDVPSTSPTIQSIGTTKPGAIVMDKDMHAVVVGVLIALIAVLCIVLGLLVLPWIRLFMRRRASNDKRRMKRRYRTVDWWLITKEVVAHSSDAPVQSGVCSCSLPNEATPPCSPPPSCTSHENGSDENDEATTPQQPECSICMEGFPLNSLVSWSPIPQGCLHAYHKDCIREWLLRHIECPYCRQIMLPIDKCASRRPRTSRPALPALAAERARRHDETQFCQVHGVVEVVVRSSDDAGSGGRVAEDVAAESSCSVVVEACIGQPQVASVACQREILGHVSLSSIVDDENEELPTESPVPEVDGSTQLPFEPPLARAIGHDTGVDVESQAAATH